MNRAEKIKLISIEYTQDAIGQWVESRTERSLFGYINSVSATEFFQAGLQGMKPDYRIDIWMTEYEGEELIEYNGKVYNVYRSYKRNDGRIELYVNEKKGDEA